MKILPSPDQFARKYEAGENQIVYGFLAADLDTPVSLMLKLAMAEKHSFILESVTGGEIHGRYSIVGMQPDLVWRCCGDRVAINRSALEGSDEFIDVPAPPLESLRDLISESRISLPDGVPASSAGLFGFLGYDMVRLVERLPEPGPDALGLPDSIFVRPSLVAVLDGIRNEVIIISPAWTREGVSAADAYAQASGRVLGAVKRLNRPSTLQSRSLGPVAEMKEPDSNLTRDEFLSIVSRAKDYIRAGDIFQVVPSLRWIVRFDLPSFAFYRALRRTNPSPFMFYFNFGGFQIVGASPEILVRVMGRQVTIRPLAGTRPRGSSADKDRELEKELLADHKERAEHLMLLDLGRNDVGRVAKYGSVRPTEQFVVERYSHVMHIVSNVIGELADDQDALSALLAGLPAGTVSGAPKIRAMEIIDELEPHKRGVYAGGVGYFSSDGDMDMCIALRTAVLKDGKLVIQAGCGVVHDSDPATEWEEAVSKSMALRKAAADAGQFLSSN